MRIAVGKSKYSPTDGSLDEPVPIKTIRRHWGDLIGHRRGLHRLSAIEPTLVSCNSKLGALNMTLAAFLNVIGLCIGFMSAIFFAVGALTMTPTKILKVAASYWDANQHWGDSIADQRADYIVGALLLLLSFSSQLLANLVPPTAEPSLLQPFGCATAEIVAALALLLVCSVFFRNAFAKSTKSQVRQLQAEVMAAQEAEAVKRRNA
jgi:hypothetical protein